MKRALFCLLFGVFSSVANAQSLPAKAVCGDGIQSTGEICDDGNTTSNDGCSYDCASLEVCGDRHLDLKEQCDDGNTTPGDGCSMSCLYEPSLKLPEKARRRALVGTMLSYPILIVASAQIRGTDGTAAASFLGLTTGLAPSLGHFYTRAYGRGAATSVARYILNAGTSLTVAFFSSLNETAPLNQENTNQAIALTSLFLIPSIIISVWDIRDAPLSIDRMKARGKYR
jgi:cysteine-rich repeat protein